MIPLSPDRPHPTALRPLDWRAFVLAALFALASLTLTTQANRFPSTYHPDEPSKARQVLNGEFNFHHPMLMLATTRSLLPFASSTPDAEGVTFAGRLASALFTAGAIFCLVLLAAQFSGALAAFVAGCLLVTNHQLFELAHYFKEDPSLLFGIAAFFLALVSFDRKPTAIRALALGVALGLAISGKYLGAVVAPLAVGLIWLRRRETAPGPAFALCLAGAILVFSLLNLPIFFDPAGFTAGFEREAEFAVAGHKGITRSVPHGVYGAVFRQSTNPVIWVLLGVFYLAFLLRRPRPRASEWMVAFFPIAFALLLSFSPKTHHRYFLPATAILLVLAAGGAAAFARIPWKGRPLGAWPVLLVLALALGVQAPRFLEYYHGFGRDGRSAMAAYLAAHVPPGAVIVQDKRVDLDALRLPYVFRGKLFAADEGTLDELRSEGVAYVAVAEGDYGRFEARSLRATDAGADEFNRRREFYRRLFAEGTLLHECPPGRLQYLQPRLKLYRLPPAP